MKQVIIVIVFIIIIIIIIYLRPQGAVKISRFPAREATSEYINAVYVDGFRIKDLFIVTQLPIVNTVGDFWRMVYEKNISLIVMLNEMDLSDEVGCTTAREIRVVNGHFLCPGVLGLLVTTM
ncbi:hypothetical protein PR048_000460 [Dryococelus australis]|uniref:Tyrosine-protein phosphatase domain-containing protein n=1 Tax=Dryococelus australis TaxID=614101 RepID=A0ABQ9IG06_9NEOP|nr:hypothetical protein PR048_000460 [Dryococelus australis]